MTRKEEMTIKVQRVRDLMKHEKLKGVLLKSQAGFCWITAGGLNVVTIADVQGVASILITARDMYFVTDTIETPRMSEEEALGELGFTPISFEWFSGNELDAVAKIAPPDQVGCDLPTKGFRFMEKELRELRYRLLPSEIERYLWLGDKTSHAIETILKEVARPGMKESEVVVNSPESYGATGLIPFATSLRPTSVPIATGMLFRRNGPSRSTLC